MKKRLTIITILAASLAMLLSGCDPTILDNDGKQVRFTARSREFPSTKTGYSDYVTEGEGSNQKVFQRIDWKDGDTLRIYSPKEEEGILWSPTMDRIPTQIVNSYLDVAYSDYKLRAFDDNGDAAISVKPDDSRFSVAKLFNNGDNGLTWTGNAATFYGAYPVRDSRLVPHALDLTTTPGENQHLLMEIVIPGAKAQNAGTNADGQTGDPTFVSTMPLLAKNAGEHGTGVTSGSRVTLDFYPYFSAYEFNLSSVDQSMTINSLTISAQEGYISGHLYWDLTAVNPNSDAPGVPRADLGTRNTDADRTITVNGAWNIQPDTPANITIFGLPNDLSKITLTINFTVNGVTKNATLYLAKDGNDVVFSARKKTRINGLALKGNLWQLEIDGVVLPWSGHKYDVDAQISLQGKVAIKGAIENTYLWQRDVGSVLDARHRVIDNHYQTDGSYSQFYQLRILNTHPSDLGYFEMEFQPTAPTGGYWELIPTFKDGDTESRKHFRFSIYRDAAWVNVGMDELTGQITNQPVKIRILPDEDYDLSNTNPYYMWFKYYCRATKNSAPISGDSEFQDVHGDGRFSYWTFVLGPAPEEAGNSFDPTVPAPSGD